MDPLDSRQLNPVLQTIIRDSINIEMKIERIIDTFAKEKAELEKASIHAAMAARRANRKA